MDNPQPCVMIVSIDPPYVILEVRSARNKKILGFGEDTLRGCSIQIFQGPKTDANLMTSVIADCKSFKTSTIQIDLYDKLKQRHKILAILSPHSDALGVIVGCMLSIEPSRAIFLSKALEDSSNAKILVSSDPNGMIELVSKEFCREFSVLPDQILGKPVNSISKLFPFPDHLAALIAISAAGRAARGETVILSGNRMALSCFVSCLPVVEELSGRIVYVLALFVRDDSDNARSFKAGRGSSELSEVRQDSLGSGAGAGAGAGGAAAPAAGAAAGGDAGGAAGPGAGGARSGAGGAGAGAGATLLSTVTLEELRELLPLPMQQAAERLGMSVSSLKAVCRRLGIARWPRAGAAPAALDVAYLRRLCRKYRPRPERGAGEPGASLAPGPAENRDADSDPAAAGVSPGEGGSWGPSLPPFTGGGEGQVVGAAGAAGSKERTGEDRGQGAAEGGLPAGDEEGWFGRAGDGWDSVADSDEGTLGGSWASWASPADSGGGDGDGDPAEDGARGAGGGRGRLEWPPDPEGDSDVGGAPGRE